MKIEIALGRCAACPGHQPFARPLANDHHQDEDCGGHPRQCEGRGGKSFIGDEGSADRRARRDADRLSPEHISIDPLDLAGRKDVDCQSVHRNILNRRGEAEGKGKGGEQADFVHAGVRKRHREKCSNDARLADHDPRTPSPHRQKDVAIHHEAVDQLERPGQNDQRQYAADRCCRCPVLREPCRKCVVDQAKRQTLRKVEEEQRDDPQLAVFAEHERPAHGHRRCVKIWGEFDHRPITNRSIGARHDPQMKISDEDTFRPCYTCTAGSFASHGDRSGGEPRGRNDGLPMKRR